MRIIPHPVDQPIIEVLHVNGDDSPVDERQPETLGQYQRAVLLVKFSVIFVQQDYLPAAAIEADAQFGNPSFRDCVIAEINTSLIAHKACPEFQVYDDQAYTSRSEEEQRDDVGRVSPRSVHYSGTFSPVPGPRQHSMCDEVPVNKAILIHSQHFHVHFVVIQPACHLSVTRPIGENLLPPLILSFLILLALFDLGLVGRPAMPEDQIYIKSATPQKPAAHYPQGHSDKSARNLCLEHTDKGHKRSDTQGSQAGGISRSDPCRYPRPVAVCGRSSSLPAFHYALDTPVDQPVDGARLSGRIVVQSDELVCQRSPDPGGISGPPLPRLSLLLEPILDIVAKEPAKFRSLGSRFPGLPGPVFVVSFIFIGFV